MFTNSEIVGNEVVEFLDSTFEHNLFGVTNFFGIRTIDNCGCGHKDCRVIIHHLIFFN